MVGEVSGKLKTKSVAERSRHGRKLCGTAVIGGSITRLAVRYLFVKANVYQD